jgi:hypothetical protein
MKNITQKDDFGCGVACTASVLDLTYEKAKALFSKPKQAKDFGFLCKDIVNALKKKGFTYDYKYIKPKIKKQIYKQGTIVFIARSKRFPAGHYLARDQKKGWMDPWINFPSDISNVKSGFRKRLPGKPIYAILPILNIN